MDRIVKLMVRSPRTAIGVVQALVWIALTGGAGTDGANAFPPPRFENAAEQVLGTIGHVPAEQFHGVKGGGTHGIIVEAGTIRLFDMDGFGVDGIRVTVRRNRFAMAVHGAVCSSPVGGEQAAGISLRFEPESRISFGMRLDAALLSIESCERASLLSTSSFVTARLGEGCSVGCAAEELYLSAAAPAGVDLSLCAAGHYHRIATGVCQLRIDRRGETSLGYAASLYMGTILRGLVGYEGASQQVKTAVAVASDSWTCEICVLIHPVLGLSKGIFLRWGP